MDAEHMLGSLIRGALTSRGKRGSRTAQFLTGAGSSLITPAALLGVAGVAWGIYEVATERSQGAVPPRVPTPPPLPQPPLPPLPPLPVEAPPTEALRLLRVAIGAACADGSLAPPERAALLEHARQAGVEGLVEQELARPRPLAELAQGVDPARREALYALAFAMVRADESVSGTERIWLARLAQELGLEPASVARLEAAAAARIDAQQT